MREEKGRGPGPLFAFSQLCLVAVGVSGCGNPTPANLDLVESCVVLVCWEWILQQEPQAIPLIASENVRWNVESNYLGGAMFSCCSVDGSHALASDFKAEPFIAIGRAPELALRELTIFRNGFVFPEAFVAGFVASSALVASEALRWQGGDGVVADIGMTTGASALAGTVTTDGAAEAEEDSDNGADGASEERLRVDNSELLSSITSRCGDGVRATLRGGMDVRRLYCCSMDSRR